MKKTLFISIIIPLLFFVGVKAFSQGKQPTLSVIDPYTIVSDKNLLNHSHPINSDGSINMIVEIPAGTIAKWEVFKPDGNLRWEFKNGKPRVVNYLAYPCNYGMIPQTRFSKEMGGDGDPLDVILLGHAIARGSVVESRIIGILKLLDKGEQDDKIIAVPRGTFFDEVESLDDLNENFPGITTILATWFENYKGKGKVEFQGFANALEAKRIIEQSTLKDTTP